MKYVNYYDLLPIKVSRGKHSPRFMLFSEASAGICMDFVIHGNHRIQYEGTEAALLQSICISKPFCALFSCVTFDPKSWYRTTPDLGAPSASMPRKPNIFDGNSDSQTFVIFTDNMSLLQLGQFHTILLYDQKVGIPLLKQHWPLAVFEITFQVNHY